MIIKLPSLSKIKRANLFTLFFLSFFFFLSFQNNGFSQSQIQVKAGSSLEICNGESTTLEVLINASINPYTVIYSDGSTNYTITNYRSDADPESETYGGDAITISPNAKTTYSLVKVTDQFGIVLSPVITSEVTVTVNPLPTNITATINSGNPVCYGVLFEISASATNGSTYELWNEANTVKVDNMPYSATITANTNYTIRAISKNGCELTKAITVQLENTPPTISGEGNKTINPTEGTCSAILPDYTSTVTVTDNCTLVGDIVLTQNPVAGSTISNHNTIQPVVISAKDKSGNTSTYNFNVTLVDTQNPTITCVGDQSVAANSGCSYVHSGTTWNAVGADNCSVASVIYSLSGATSGTGNSLNGVIFSVGATTVTWTVTDAAGLTASCKFDVEISDTIKPTVTCVENQIITTNVG